MHTNFIDFQRYVLEAHVSGVVFKVRVPGVGHFVSLGETGSDDFPPDCILWLQGWGLCRDIVSASSNDLFIYLLMILCQSLPKQSWPL